MRDKLAYEGDKMKELTPFEECKKAIEQLKVRKARCIRELKAINKLEKDIIFIFYLGRIIYGLYA